MNNNQRTPVLFSSGLESASLAATSGLLSSAWKLISDLHAENNSNGELFWKKVTNESDLTIVVFVTTQLHLQHDLRHSSDMMDNPLQFMRSGRIPSSSLNNSAISLIDKNFSMLQRLKKQIDVEKPLIVTGHAVGGSIASLFTLWLFDEVDPGEKHPLCITFGSPLIGDKKLQEAVSRRYRWNSSFLHVASREDPFPSSFTSIDLYRPFGTYLFCSDYGSACVENPDSSLTILKAMRPMNHGFKSGGYNYGYIVENLERNAICKDSSASNIAHPDVLQACFDLQLRTLGFTELQEQGSAPAVEGNVLCRKVTPRVSLFPFFISFPKLAVSLFSFIFCKPCFLIFSSILNRRHKKAPTQPRINTPTIRRKMIYGPTIQNINMNKLVKDMERNELLRIVDKRKRIIPMKRLGEMGIYMANLEWFKKASNTRRIGYYNVYRNESFPTDLDVVKFVKILNNYWKDMVEEAMFQPQKEDAHFRNKWLFSGNSYRRMVEPLEIALYYRQGGRDYMNRGRSEQFKKLEQWLQDKKYPETKSSKQNIHALLTMDSCFWAHVEEALISCQKLKAEGYSVAEKKEAREKLEEFENYVYGLLSKYKVSSDIFLEECSYMRWWHEYIGIMGNSYDSRLARFMRNPANCKLYEKGAYDFPPLFH